MNKIFLPLLLGSVLLFGDSPYSGSTLAPVNLAGGIIKATHNSPTKNINVKIVQFARARDGILVVMVSKK